MDAQERRHLLMAHFRQIYGGAPEIWVQCPGRVDLMGSHTDYNEGYVLTMTVDRTTWIAARPRTDARVAVHSLNLKGGGAFDLDHIRRDAHTPWTNYVRGVAAAFKADGYALRGFDALVHSTIPPSSGLSSSAALEVATARLFQALGGWRIDPVRMALLCQRAENEFVGMNCGILDQYTVTMGQVGHALVLDCRHLTSEPAQIAKGIQVVICDTQTKRELTGSEYPERRAQCEEGAARIAQFYPEVKTLRDVTLAQLDAHRDDLPEVVLRRSRFIIEENARVIALGEALSTDNRSAVAALCAASFAGARDLYEIVSQEMVAIMDAILSGPGVVGARQAGAGFGGCMVAFVEHDQVPDFAQHVEDTYRRAVGIDAKVFPVYATDGAALIQMV